MVISPGPGPGTGTGTGTGTGPGPGPGPGPGTGTGPGPGTGTGTGTGTGPGPGPGTGPGTGTGTGTDKIKPPLRAVKTIKNIKAVLSHLFISSSSSMISKKHLTNLVFGMSFLKGVVKDTNDRKSRFMRTLLDDVSSFPHWRSPKELA